MNVICCLQDTQFQSKDTYRMKREEMEKDIPGKWKWKESWGSSTLIKETVKQRKALQIIKGKLSFIWVLLIKKIHYWQLTNSI